MTWKPSDKPLRKPGTIEEEIDSWIATLAAIPDPAVRCRELQKYVRSLLRTTPLIPYGYGCESKEEAQREIRRMTKGRFGNPQARREQLLADWDTFDAVEDILIKGRASSIAAACDQLAQDRNPKLYADGKNHKAKKGHPDRTIRDAYYRHTHTAFYPASSRVKRQP